MGIRIRRQTTKSLCQITMATNNDGDGRCDSIFVHIKLLTSAPHWHIDYWHIDWGGARKHKKKIQDQNFKSGTTPGNLSRVVGKPGPKKRGLFQKLKNKTVLSKI